MSKRMHRQEGFTLIELMIVILIIGILVGIAVPVFLAARSGAESKTCLANQRTVVSAANIFAADTEAYPASMANLYPNYIDNDFIDSDNGGAGAENACPDATGVITWNWDVAAPPAPNCSIHGSP